MCVSKLNNSENLKEMVTNQSVCLLYVQIIFHESLTMKKSCVHVFSEEICKSDSCEELLGLCPPLKHWPC